jgi:hypothetical protein
MRHHSPSSICRHRTIGDIDPLCCFCLHKIFSALFTSFVGSALLLLLMIFSSFTISYCFFFYIYLISFTVFAYFTFSFQLSISSAFTFSTLCSLILLSLYLRYVLTRFFFPYLFSRTPYLIFTNI